MAPVAGEVIDGRYALKTLIGEGGMGAVWLAENVSLKGSEVALKVLHSAFCRDETVVKRFRAEAEASVRIGHPNIVKVFDFGELQDGTPYLVMERLCGESLADRLEREGALIPSEAAEILCEVLDALEAAHEKDIVHRDLKPENLFLARDGEKRSTKILDFGVSKILGSDAERVRLTRTGALVGTPAYMAPEQAMGDSAIDTRTDLWAMGVILYELVSGRLPYDGQNYNAVLVQIVMGRPRPVTDHVPTLDPGLVAIIDRAMARNPRARFPSARSMREALRDWLGSDGARRSLRPPPRNPTPVRMTPMAFESAETLPGHATVADPPRRTWRALAVVSALLVAAAVGRSIRRPVSEARATVHRAAAAQALTLSIRGLPRGAHVSVDDAPVMLPTSLPGDRVHRVRVEAPGYQTWGMELPPSAGPVALRYQGSVAEQPAPAAPAVPAIQLAPSPQLHRAPPRGRVRPRAPAAPARPANALISDPGF